MSEPIGQRPRRPQLSGRCRGLRRELRWRHAVGPIESFGVEHRRTVGHHVGHDVTTGIRRPAYSVFGGAGAGERRRVGEIDPDLEDSRLGVEDRGEPGDVVVLGQRTASRGRRAANSVRRMCARSSVPDGALDELKKRVALAQDARVPGDSTVVEHQEPSDLADVNAAVQKRVQCRCGDGPVRSGDHADRDRFVSWS